VFVAAQRGHRHVFVAVPLCPPLVVEPINETTQYHGSETVPPSLRHQPMIRKKRVSTFLIEPVLASDLLPSIIAPGSSRDPARSLRTDEALRFSHSHWYRKPGRVMWANFQSPRFPRKKGIGVKKLRPTSVCIMATFF